MPLLARAPPAEGHPRVAHETALLPRKRGFVRMDREMSRRSPKHGAQSPGSPAAGRRGMRRGRPVPDVASSEADRLLPGADGLLDEPRKVAIRGVPDAAIGRLIVRAMKLGPAGSNHWSTRSLAMATGLSRSTASRVRRAFALRVRRVEALELPEEPRLVGRLRDVAAVRLYSPECVLGGLAGGKPRNRAPDRIRPLLSTGPGKIERRTHD